MLVGTVLLIGALVGWIASLNLTVDKMYLLEHPDAELACDINPLISCGNVMMTWQAEALGIPNMAIGLGGFAIMGRSEERRVGKEGCGRCARRSSTRTG